MGPGTSGRRGSKSRQGTQLVSSLAAAGVTAAALTASAQADVTIDRFGSYSLGHLGYSTQMLTGAELQRGVSVQFVLPPEANVGPGHWYILRLHAAVEIDRGSSGTGYVSAVSSDYGSAQVTFKVAKGKPIRWQTVGLLSGAQTHTSNRRRIEFRFANFIPYNGLHPGKNAIHFSVEQFGGRPIRSFTVFEDSAIEYTPRGPGQLVAEIERSNAVARTGKRFVTTLHVRNVGQRPVRRIQVSAILGGPGLRLIGSSVRSRSELRPSGTLFESFAFIPEEPRSFRVFFLVSSSANRPGAELNFRAIGRPQPRAKAEPTAGQVAADGKRVDKDGVAWKIALGAVLGAALLSVALFQLLIRRRL